MGLDMFAYKAQNFQPSKPVDFQEELPSEIEEFFYWRKHPNLHGLMEQIYREKGGENDQFNCRPVQLTAEDLERIGLAVIDEQLPETSGFFFGESLDEDRKRDLKFLTESKRYLDEGYTIWYDSWW
jgi:hypothetical protein